VRINAVQIGQVVERMLGWIRERDGCHSIAATSMHGIVEAQHDPSFKEILNSADLVVARRHATRVVGPAPRSLPEPARLWTRFGPRLL